MFIDHSVQGFRGVSMRDPLLQCMWACDVAALYAVVIVKLVPGCRSSDSKNLNIAIIYNEQRRVRPPQTDMDFSSRTTREDGWKLWTLRPGPSDMYHQHVITSFICAFLRALVPLRVQLFCRATGRAVVQVFPWLNAESPRPRPA